MKNNFVILTLDRDMSHCNLSFPSIFTLPTCEVVIIA